MRDTHETTHSVSLADVLRGLAERCNAETVTLGEIITSMGNRGFGMILILLSLPSAMPVPAPGYSTPFGILMVLLGAQMLVGKPIPYLPNWALKRELKASTMAKIFRAGARFFEKIEYLIKPRFAWIGSRGGQSLISLLVMIMAILMIIPIPLTNTAPAGVIFVLGVGLLERDGLAIAFGAFVGWLAVILYSVIIYAIVFLGTNPDQIKEMVKGFLGM